MLEMGVITYKEALTHPQRNYITRALGTGKTVEPDILRLDYKPAKARTRRNRDFCVFNLTFARLIQKLFVAGNMFLVFCLTAFCAHVDPLKLALKGFLAF